MVKAANLGFPRMGLNRELKKAVEGYWKGALSQADLGKTADHIRRRHETTADDRALVAIRAAANQKTCERDADRSCDHFTMELCARRSARACMTSISPRIPKTEEMERLLRKALEVLRPDQVWVNPDCGLKTRG